MPNPVEALIYSWGDNDLNRINLRIQHMERRLYKSYEPNKFEVIGSFWARLEKWIENVSSDADKKTLLRILDEIIYIGPEEFEELYRCAFQGPIARWLIDQAAIDICAADARQQLDSAMQETWFCPVTDSFRVNAFFHINNIQVPADLRPDWRSLETLGDLKQIATYCHTNGIRRIVLLEDFVGGGSQSLSAVNFATQVPNVRILFVPLVICPAGASNFKAFVQSKCATAGNELVRYEAVLELPSESFLTPTTSPFASPQTSADVHALLASTYPAVSGGASPGVIKPYHPYGFPAVAPTGGLVVMFSNTPDNTLPIIHWRPASNSWSPIFPRHSRV